MRNAVRILLLVFLLTGCKKNAQEYSDNPELIHSLNLALMEAVVQDGFSPPVASRVYAYPNIAAYESVIHSDTGFISYVGQLRDLQALPQPDPDKKYLWEVVMVKAFCDVARVMVYRDHIIDQEEVKLLDSLKAEHDDDLFELSFRFGAELAYAVVQWAGTDGYNETRNMPKYTVVDTPGAWLPTPPKYLEGLEPHWMKVRPFVLDSASQFREKIWYKFSTDTSSEFYKIALETYRLAEELNDEQEEIAKFWDCNPSPADIQGHVMTTNRQNTPGGHWLGIARIAAKRENLNLAETCEALSTTAIAIADAFKTIWDTKYAWANIRPVTYIGKYINPNWSPLLETPNFPEFSSGHSGVSAAAAYILTGRFGDNFSFTDSTNISFGLPARKFNSFEEASGEVAISRIYGGIHYIPSCNVGTEQGTKVGKLVADKLVTRKNQ